MYLITPDLVFCSLVIFMIISLFSRSDIGMFIDHLNRFRWYQLLKKWSVSVVVFFIALLILFNDWVWDRLKPILEYLSKFRIIQKMEKMIIGMGLYMSLSLFVIPATITNVAELWAVKLIANGKVFSGTSIYLVAKVLGFIVLTRIFSLTKPKLMQVKWFKKCYDWFIEMKHKLYERMDQIGIWKLIKRMKASAKEKLSYIKERLLSGKRSWIMKAFSRLRRSLPVSGKGVASGGCQEDPVETGSSINLKPSGYKNLTILNL